MKRLAILLAVVCCGSAAAEDVWILRGFASVPGCHSNQIQTIWRADAILHNRSDGEARIIVRDVSNGGRYDPSVITIPPHGVKMLSNSAKDTADAPLWMTHLDVPPTVVVEGRLEYRFASCSLEPQPDAALGKVATPAFRTLTPPGVTRFHPGSDLGSQNVRINVGVYNAGEVDATAVIEIRRPGCPASEPTTNVVTIPPRSVVQASISRITPPCVEPVEVREWVLTTTVTMDQPGLSFTSILANSERPNITYGFGSGSD